MVKRTFYKVGNGLFAMEEANGIVSVYDCGGQTLPIIMNAISKASSEIPQRHIDNLFISHYHSDHINGITNLLSKFNVDRIILPMIPNLIRVINYSATDLNDSNANLILNPEQFIENISPNTKVIEVGDVGGDNRIDLGDNADVNIDGLTGNKTFNDEAINFHFNGWLYVVYNRRVLTKAELTAFMNKLGLPVSATSADIINVLKMVNPNSLKQSLEQVFTETDMNLLNNYSMVVWSGKNATIDKGCLYTGDYNAKSFVGDIKTVFGAYLPNSEIIQIPHHGSINNFHEDICSSKATHVISASPGPYRSRKIVDPTNVINEITSKLIFKEEDTRYNDITI